ncbi:aminotransferase class III-fold pyridoxal phosphate-dependent enzyme [Sphingomonas quercus]|uniref:Aminotransferase class III-fold pyridoxal phosphate-dependent enzyme n=1 Tax=Sphingomonas quercus TaxID=2842451 RepID=A0ABS6BN33_9SPHN|nr:aminotransferase class III-fold pyridoxal phosphate-dependent enzyme [Sphingomonas quercus]MBU3079211.1 aminotransferase class III-fold pyridoxal phosphate-dependent enzyme [Sphingomonas quercus]
MPDYALPVAAGALALLAAAPSAWARLALSQAKHRSLTGHARMSRKVARLIRFYELGEERFFRADDAPADIAAQREAGFDRLAALYAERFPKTKALAAEMGGGLSDLQFTTAYRVPFQFSRKVREALPSGAVAVASSGVTLTDADGNQFYDLTGSFGLNLLGTDAYKAMIAEGARTVEALGPVLGTLHPVVADNIRRLKAISGLDEVSFHMSGTEAVMQAVQLARYHTGRARIVRFAGAYHGWWGEVQPGVGNPTPADRTLTLADMSERSLAVLARRKDIACVLVNPLQAMHPNGGAPGDSALVAGRRLGGVCRATYAAWLARLAEVARANGIVFIIDEVFTGFRLARGGACEYFGVQPDMVTYGKTVGGGLPIGVVCGRAELMRRSRADRPADICFARGTFNAHPHVMGSMDAFLRHIEGPSGDALYEGLDERLRMRAETLDRRLAEHGLPLRIAALGTIWSVQFERPSRYNWMLQYYLRAQGLALSWVGTGRLIFSLAYTDDDFAEVVDRFVTAARTMAADGWWWVADGATDTRVRRKILREMVRRG